MNWLSFFCRVSAMFVREKRTNRFVFRASFPASMVPSGLVTALSDALRTGMRPLGKSGLTFEHTLSSRKANSKRAEKLAQNSVPSLDP
jgi:hypothetical protein